MHELLGLRDALTPNLLIELGDLAEEGYFISGALLDKRDLFLDTLALLLKRELAGNLFPLGGEFERGDLFLLGALDFGGNLFL